MKAAKVHHFGKDGVRLATEPIPKATAGHLVIRIHAAGINPIDFKVREGYIPTLQLPMTSGGDLSGVVEEVGEGVNGFQKGDIVFGDASVFGKGTGSFAEYASVDAGTIASIPSKLDHTHAAALPLAGVSALQALTEHIGLKKGDKILIHGGAGGIGSFAIQIAKHLGAYVATTVRAGDIDYVKMLGADEIIDYQSRNFEDILHNFDSVFDTVAGDTYGRSFKVLRKGGIIVSMLEKPDEQLMSQYGVRAVAQQTHITTDRLTRLSKMVESGAIKVHIDKVFPFDKAADALSYLQRGHHRGKVVLTVAG